MNKVRDIRFIFMNVNIAIIVGKGFELYFEQIAKEENPMYGIYSKDTLVDTAETEAEAELLVESLNSPDPFALPFEKCVYVYREM
ncbi:MAG: hypothetical protein Q8935_10145 [Bacillota bacterium]|nr:hypothetical protein [Bacillota bacterium]